MTGWLSRRSIDGGIDEIPLGHPAGRLSLCGKHVVGPDPEHALAEAGASMIVCLNQAYELDDRYPDYVEWLHANHPSRVVWFPIHDLHAPPMAQVVPFLEGLEALLDDGHHLLMHCGAGIGRAGTMAASLLIRRGVALEAALQTVSVHRPLAGPEAGTQRQLIADLAAQSTR